MESKPLSPKGFSFINIAFVIISLLFCLALYIFIGKGGAILSYYTGDAPTIQGTLVEKQFRKGNTKGVHTIEFTGTQGQKEYFYQLRHQRFRKQIGSPEGFRITSEGILLDSLISHHIKFFIGLLILTPILLALFLITGLCLCSQQQPYREHGAGTRIGLFFLRLIMLGGSIWWVAFSYNEVRDDFCLRESTVVVTSVKRENASFIVGVRDLTNGKEFEQSWKKTASEASPATGQELRVVFPSNSPPMFASIPSAKVYSVLLLCISLTGLTFTAMAFLRMFLGMRPLTDAAPFSIRTSQIHKE